MCRMLANNHWNQNNRKNDEPLMVLSLCIWEKTWEGGREKNCGRFRRYCRYSCKREERKKVQKLKLEKQLKDNKWMM